MTMPPPPPPLRRTQVLIIGGGPGGYVAGIRCGQLGLETIVVDDEPLGGTCLNVGCIPSKALIHAADELTRATTAASATSPLGIRVADPTIDLAATMAWKDGIVGRLNRGVATLLKRAGTEVVRGRATVVDGKTCDISLAEGDGSELVRIRADHLVLATGSTPVELPGLPFGEGDGVISSTGALALTEIPRSMAVVGGGYIGIELGTAYAKLGTSVTIVEAEDRPLPVYDAELVGPVVRRLDELGVTVLTGARAEGRTPAGLRVSRPRTPPGAGGEAGGPGEDGRIGGVEELEVEAEVVLVTVGRRPATEGWGLERLRLTLDGPFVAVDERCRTSMRDVWAIGDLTGEPMLAHRAMRQGEVVAEAIAGQPSGFAPEAIPAIVFGDPEIVVVGLSPEEAADQLGEEQVTVGRFPFGANGRAMTLDRTTGFVRVVARTTDHRIVGIQAVGAAVAELAGAFSLAMETGVCLEDVARTIHAHPTLGEAFGEAALDGLGRALHRS
jgi:dihydrolipoamide dehydrogenase